MGGLLPVPSSVSIVCTDSIELAVNYVSATFEVPLSLFVLPVLIS